MLRFKPPPYYLLAVCPFSISVASSVKWDRESSNLTGREVPGPSDPGTLEPLGCRRRVAFLASLRTDGHCPNPCSSSGSGPRTHLMTQTD